MGGAKTGVIRFLFVQRFFLCVLLLLFFSGCSATTNIAVKKDTTFSKYKKVYLLGFTEDPRNILPKAEAKLAELGFEVIVTKPDESIGGTQGTGFIISPDGYVLTAGHVLEKKKEATVWLNGQRYEADLVFKDAPETEKEEVSASNKNETISEAMDKALNSKDNQSIYEFLNQKDMALLKIRSDQTFTPVSLASDPAYKMGQEVYTIGFPLSQILGDAPRLTQGLVSSVVGIKDNPNFIQVSAAVQPGNSGGPLINKDGQVIGMIEMTLDSLAILNQTGGALPQNVNFAFRNEVIHEFLKAVPDPKPVVVENAVISLDQVQNSIVQIRSGIVSDEFRKESKLGCSIAYSSIWDMWFRFQVFQVTFFDIDTQEILLKAGQYGDDPFSSENKTIDKTFKEIAQKLDKVIAPEPK